MNDPNFYYNQAIGGAPPGRGRGFHGRAPMVGRGYGGAFARGGGRAGRGAPYRGGFRGGYGGGYHPYY